MIKIAYYCQHVLGIGHLHRSLEICRALAKHSQVTMITGGAPVETEEEAISIFQLPGLVMDADFQNLAPCDSTRSLEETKKIRAQALLDFFIRVQPDVFLVELYPFGRKAFRFELDPLLERIKTNHFNKCLTFCSVRDILVERHDQEKFEKRIISTLNSLFDGVIVHGDENLVALETTFSRVKDIAIPLAYTGYVAPLPQLTERSSIRKTLGISSETQLIVASIGGGGVGIELLCAVVKAMEYVENNSIQLQIFTGPYTEEEDVRNLKSMVDNRISIERFTPDFTRWLNGADLSVSMAGYNTTMAILAAGVPALLYPFSQNQEQRLRVSRLAQLAPLTILEEEDLQPRKLAAHLLSQLQEKRYRSPIHLDGASRAAKQVLLWHAAKRG